MLRGLCPACVLAVVVPLLGLALLLPILGEGGSYRSSGETAAAQVSEGEVAQASQIPQEETAQNLSNADADTAQGHYARGLDSMKVGKWDEAVAEFSQAVSLNDRLAEAHCQLGIAFLEKGFADTATVSLNRSLELQPNLAEAYCARGRAAIALNDTYRAIRDCTRAILLNPASAEAYFERSQAYLLDANVGSGLRDLAESERLDKTYVEKGKPVKARLKGIRGLRGVDARKWDAAIADLSEAITLTSGIASDIAAEYRGKLSHAYCQRARQQIDEQRYTAAEADLKEAMSVDQPAAECYAVRSILYSRTDRLQEAVDDCDLAVLLNPSLRMQLRKELAYAYYDRAYRLKISENEERRRYSARYGTELPPDDNKPETEAEFYLRKAKELGWQSLFHEPTRPEERRIQWPGLPTHDGSAAPTLESS